MMMFCRVVKPTYWALPLVLVGVLSGAAAWAQAAAAPTAGDDTVVVGGPSAPGVVIDKVYATLTPQRRPLESVTVSNSSDQAINVEVQVFEVKSKTQEKEELVPAQAVRVSPSRFSLPPRGDRLTRVIYTESFGEQERLFRVRYVPVATPLTGEAEAAGSLQTKVQVQIGMGLLLAISPRQPKPALTFKRDATGVTFKNEGNVHVMFRRSRVCPDNASTGCFDLPGGRLYPGLTWRAAVSQTGPLVFPYQVYGTEARMAVPAWRP